MPLRNAPDNPSTKAPNTVRVRFYFNLTPILEDGVISPLGQYIEIDVLPPPDLTLPRALRNPVVVTITKEIDLDLTLIHLNPGSTSSATYDGTTLYVRAATYEEAYWALQRVLKDQAGPPPFPGAIKS